MGQNYVPKIYKRPPAVSLKALKDDCWHEKSQDLTQQSSTKYEVNLNAFVAMG